MLRIVLASLCAAALLSLGGAAAPGIAAAVERGAGEGGVSRAPVGEDEPRVTLAPVRFDPVPAAPGSQLRFALVVTNATPQPVELRPAVVALEGADDPDSSAQAAAPGGRSWDAVEWVTFRDLPQQLAPGTMAEFTVLVRVPEDARPGTRALGIGVSQRIGALGAATDEAAQSRVRLTTTLASQVVLRVPGEVTPDARLRRSSAPRVVWAGDQPVFRAWVENVGDTDLLLDAAVELDAFWGVAGRRLAADEQPVLPGGTRRFELRWTDPPLLGWFEPQLVVVGGKGSGVRITRTLPTVFVLPPWWLVALLVLATALPLRAGWRRRRQPRHEHPRR